MPPPALLESILHKYPTVIAASPCWLYAAESRVDGEVWGYVYRSVEQRDDDEDYEPVRNWLGARSWSPIYHGEFPDEDMMFGKAELWVYQLRK